MAGGEEMAKNHFFETKEEFWKKVRSVHAAVVMTEFDPFMLQYLSFESVQIP